MFTETIAEKETKIVELMATVSRQREIIDRMLTAGNHIATYRTDRWPGYQLDGLDRREHCEHALRVLGATKDYDMWCCWSAMMQARDELED